MCTCPVCVRACMRVRARVCAITLRNITYNLLRKENFRSAERIWVSRGGLRHTGPMWLEHDATRQKHSASTMPLNCWSPRTRKPRRLAHNELCYYSLRLTVFCVCVYCSHSLNNTQNNTRWPKVAPYRITLCPIFPTNLKIIAPVRVHRFSMLRSK